MNVTFVNESHVAWVFRVDFDSHSVAVKAARPQNGTASGVPVRLDADRRNRLIRHEVAVRGCLRDCDSVLPALACGDQDGMEFFATAWITTDAVAPAGSSAAWAEAVALTAVVSDLHARGIAHGDLEPEHVLVSDQRIWLLDFGSAESIAEDNRAAERDIFALGCYLAERLLGFPRFPYRAQGEVGEARRLAGRLPAAPVADVVRRALAIWIGLGRPYRGVGELERDLQEAFAGWHEHEGAPGG